jgi:hypothetical protein
MILVPAAGETVGVLSTVQFQLAIATMVGLLAPRLASRVHAALEAGVMFIVGLSGPFSILLLPVAIARDRRDPRSLAVIAAALIQLVVLVTAGRIPVGTDMTLADRLSFLVSHGVVEPGVGMYLTAVLQRDWLLVLGMGLLMAAVLSRVIGSSAWPWVYLWAATIVLAVVSPQGGRLEYLEAGTGLRYVVTASVCLAAVVLGGRRGYGRAVMLSLLSVAVVVDFRIPPRSDVGWVAASSCIGGVDPCRVAIDSNGPDWGIVWPGSNGEYSQYPYPPRFLPE